MLDFNERGEYSSGVFGYKYQTLDYMERECDRLYRFYKDTLLRKPSFWLTDRTQAIFAMNTFLKIPGLGMAKAGFLTQLLIGKSWCADVNNLEWFGVDYAQFGRSWHKMRPRTLLPKIDRYLSYGERLGGTARLWNNWCRQIAKKYPQLEDAANVSSLHWRVHDDIPF